MKPETIRRALEERSHLEIDFSLGFPTRFSYGMMLGARVLSLYGRDTQHAFGHLGFTNMLAWADPERGISVGILNNGKPIVYPEVHRFLGTMQKVTSEMPKVDEERAPLLGANSVDWTPQRPMGRRASNRRLGEVACGDAGAALGVITRAQLYGRGHLVADAGRRTASSAGGFIHPPGRVRGRARCSRPGIGRWMAAVLACGEGAGAEPLERGGAVERRRCGCGRCDPMCRFP